MLSRGQIKAALNEANETAQASSHTPDADCMIGDIRFWQADFDAAEEAYSAAIRNFPDQACGHWGMGRIRGLQFDREGAMQFFARAYRLDPNDLDVIWSYAGAASDAETHKRLLQRFVNLASSSPKLVESESARIGDAVARLQIANRVGENVLGQAGTSAVKHRIQLERYYGGGSSPVGLLITARIGQSRLLRLLLDTGGSGILVNARALRKISLETITHSSVEGLGSGAAKTADIALAPTVEIGTLRLRNVAVQVVSPPVIQEADGVIGGDMFRDFLITLDAKNLTLELTPFSADEAADCSSCGRSVPVYALSHYLLVRATVDGSKPGYYLLDTGSANSIVRARPDLLSSSVMLRGAQGLLSGAARRQPASIRIGSGEWYDPAPVSADLREMSRRHGVEISGTLGYSLVSQVVLTINYRDGLVRLAPH